MRLYKKVFSAIAIVGVLCLAVFAFRTYKSLSNVKKLHVYSSSLRKEMNVDVYLPPNYSESIQYPVLYLLHGKGANQNSWFDSIHIAEDATSLIHQGKIRPLIIVSPEIDNGYGINTSSTTHSVGEYDRGQYANFITGDLVRYIDSHYSVIPSRNGRYIGGYSMGGFAALHAAFTNQNLYSKVGVMSAALWNGGLPASLSWIYPTPADEQSRDPIAIAQHARIKIPVYIIEGSSDPFYSADRTLAHELQSHKANVTLKIYPGGHDYTFWSSHANELLTFFAK